MFDWVSSFSEAFWRRHSNPKSGWSRVILLPVMLFEIYHELWWLLAGALVYALVNPVLFSPPETEDAWMTRVVLAERWWTSERRAGLLDLSYPNLLNVLNVPTFAYALFAAYTGRPVHTVVAGAASMILKFWYVHALVNRYDVRDPVDDQ